MARRVRHASIDRLESLEDRALLTVAVTYVDQLADFQVTTNNVGGPGADNGDIVTWNGSSTVTGLLFGTDAFATIQAGINGANVGGTVNVAAGNYVESVDVDKSVTLNGAQAGHAVAGRTFGAASETTVSPTSIPAILGQRAVFNVLPANVTIDGFSVGKTGNPAGYGIAQRNGSAGFVVKNNIVNGFSNTIGINVAAQAPNFPIIQGNRIENGEPGGLGIYVSNHGSATITDNTMTGLADGVFLEGGNTVAIDSNTFTDLSGVGIGLGQYNDVQVAANIVITDNSFNNVTTIINGDQPGGANDSAAVVVATGSTINGVSGVTSVNGTSGNDVLIFRLNTGVTEYTKDNGATWIPVTVGTGPLVIYGGSGDDSLTIDFTGGNPIPVGGFVFNGGAGGNDSLSFIGTGLTSATLTHTNQFDGSVVLDGRTLTYTGLDPITINTPGANWVLEYATDPAPVTLAASGADLLVTRAGVAEQVTISPAGLASLIVRTGTGADTVEFDSLPAAWTAGITIDGQAGADVINVNTADITSTGAVALTGIETANLSNNITAASISGTATTVNMNNGSSQIQDGVDLSGAGASINIATAAAYVGDVNATGVGKSVTLAPVGTGTVTVTGNLALNGGDALQVQMAGSGAGLFDNFVVSGTVALGGATLVPTLSYVPVLGVPVQIVSVGSGTPGTFAGLPEGGVVVLGADRLKVSYIGGDGNDVTLTAVGPAVSVSYANGNLVVTGTGAADTFSVQVSGTNSVTLIGTGNTNFTGSGGDGTIVGPFIVTGTLTVNTGNGNDIVNLAGSGANAQLSSGNVNIDLGSGNDTLSQTGTDPLKLTGNLSVVGGMGSDTVTLGLGTTVTDFTALKITVDNGTDDNATTQSITFDGVTANGNVALTNGGQALQQVVFGPTANNLKGNVVITQSNTANTLGYQVTASNSPVTGNLTINTGNTTGATAVAWATSNVGGTASVVNGNAASNSTVFTSSTIGGNVTLINGNAATTNVITVTGSTFSKSSTLTNGSAGTSDTINLGLGAASVFGSIVNAANNSATGANSILVQQANLNGGGSLSNSQAGATSNTVTLGSDNNVNVVGNLSITNAASTTSNTVNVDRLGTSGNKTGDLTINNGATGTTNVTFGANGLSTVNGNLTIRNQATTGTRTTTIGGTTVNGRTGFYLYNVGAGNSATTLNAVSVARVFKIEDGTGTSTLDIRTATLGSLNYSDIGGGSDLIDLAGAGGGAATVNGVVRLSTGGGSDTVRIGTLGSANLNDSVFISLADGDDELTIGNLASSPAFSTASKYQFDGGAGVDTFNGSVISLADYEGVKPGKKLKSKITNFEFYN